MYDCLIIGGGLAGLTAAIYTARAGLSTAVIEGEQCGGQAVMADLVENYPGFESISGPELSMKMFEPLEKLGVENLYGIVSGIEDKGDYKVVKTGDEEYQTKTVIIATGAKHRHIGVAGEEEYNSRGVSYCAVCDGAFFRNQDLLVVGGGDSAVEEGIYLTRFANSVTIVHRRDELRAQKVLQDRAFANEKVKFIWDSVVEEIKGDDIKVCSVDIKNVKTGEVTNHEFGGVFVYVGLDPVSDYLTGLDVTDQDGWVITDDKMATRIPGIFAIGDVRQKDLRQITTAVGDGATAGIEAYNYVTALGDK